MAERSPVVFNSYVAEAIAVYAEVASFKRKEQQAKDREDSDSSQKIGLLPEL